MQSVYITINSIGCNCATIILKELRNWFDTQFFSTNLDGNLTATLTNLELKKSNC